MPEHKDLLDLVKSLKSDHVGFGEVSDAQRTASKFWVDCSCGCRHFLPLEGPLGFDWGVCANKKSPRAGLLTFEHQAGHGCFESEGAPAGFASWEELWAKVRKNQRAANHGG